MTEIDEEKTLLLVESGPGMGEPVATRAKGDTPGFGFLFFGMVGLLCFTYFIQVIGLLTSKTRPAFASASTMVYGITSNLGQLIGIFFAPRASFGSRIWISCMMLAFTAVGYPIAINSHVPGGFYSGLGITACLGFSNAIIQSAGFGLAALVSEKAVNYLSLGQSVAGVLCWPLLLVLQYLFARAGFSNERIDGRPSMVESASVLTGFLVVAIVTLAMIPYYAFGLSDSEGVRRGLLQKTVSNSSDKNARRSTIEIVGSTMPLAITVWMNMFVTFLVFPGTLIVMEPRMPNITGEKSFDAAVLIFIFQLFDLVGKLLVVAGVRLSRAQVIILSPCRIFIAGAMFAAAGNVWVLKYDISKILLVALLGATNGLILNCAMILGPTQVPRSEADVASYVMAFFLVNGILFGSLAALLVGEMGNISPKIAETAGEMMILIQGSEIPSLPTEL